MTDEPNSAVREIDTDLGPEDEPRDIRPMPGSDRLKIVGLFVCIAAGRRTLKRLANGTRASFSYDAASNLTRLANLKSDGTTISSFDYRYDKSSNRTAVQEADGSCFTWSYDATYQLTGEHRTGSNGYRSTFTYDAAGNRTLKNEDAARTTYAYDAANQLVTSIDASGTTIYTFDADGNQQIVQPPTGNRTTTTWDHENRTTLVELPSGIRNTMAYEPSGLRVKLEDSSGTRKFIWDDQNYLAETDASEVTQVVYTNEPAYYGNLVSQRRGGTTNWYHFDAIGSTRQLTHSSEAVSDTYLYDTWGTVIVETGSTTNAFRFVAELGYCFAHDSLELYVRQRSYSSTIAQWTSLDPLRRHLGSAFGSVTIHVLHAGSFSLPPYAYAHNSPAALSDPTGLYCTQPLPQRCGPQVDTWFTNQLTLIENAVRPMTIGSDQHKTFWKTLKFEEANLVTPLCPLNCKDTVVLCRICISVTELGNIAFGYAGGLGKLPALGRAVDSPGIMLWGGFFAEVHETPGRGFDKIEEIASALAGSILRDRLKSEGLCTAVRKIRGITPDALENVIDSVSAMDDLALIKLRYSALKRWNAKHGSALGQYDDAIKKAASLLNQESGFLKANEIKECELCTDVPTEPGSLTVLPNGKVQWHAQD